MRLARRIVVMSRVNSPFGILRGRTWASLLGVLAIAIQCFLVQTHLHSWADPGAPHDQIVAFDAG